MGIRARSPEDPVTDTGPDTVDQFVGDATDTVGGVASAVVLVKFLLV